MPRLRIRESEQLRAPSRLLLELAGAPLAEKRVISEAGTDLGPRQPSQGAQAAHRRAAGEQASATVHQPGCSTARVTIHECQSVMRLVDEISYLCRRAGDVDEISYQCRRAGDLESKKRAARERNEEARLTCYGS